MPSAPALLLTALLPLWIQATSASAQLQFSEGWAHGKRSAPPPLGPSSLTALLDTLAAKGDSSEDGQQRAAPAADPSTQRDACPIDQAVLRLVYEAIMVRVTRGPRFTGDRAIFKITFYTIS